MALQPSNPLDDPAHYRHPKQQRHVENVQRELAAAFHEYYDDLYEVLDELVATHLVYREATDRWQCMFCTARPAARPDAVAHTTHPMCVVPRAMRLKRRLDSDTRLRNRRTLR